MSKDKKEEEEKKVEVVAEEAPKPQLSVSQKLYNAIAKNIEELEEGVKKKDHNKLNAVAKHNKAIRSVLSRRVLDAAIDRYLSPGTTVKKPLAAVRDVDMVVDEADTLEVPPAQAEPAYTTTPEVEAYLRLLVLLYVIDKDEKVLVCFFLCFFAVFSFVLGCRAYY
jgi:hypothetical protein